ncbi:probable cytochrome P450 301a1, mitochondrial [Ostrinia furnacalis]|uniref:probable cytochrome P450 301a1, mitochondrial n=1 Tax=Ostrinia furnacalis TaxID=93504 RepID=UPI00103F25B9|nr:probable cytochrome P450 301a1, mitochondrial [Ostrinia furnacalis]
MLLNQLRHVRSKANFNNFVHNQKFHTLDRARYQLATSHEARMSPNADTTTVKNVEISPPNSRILGEIFSTTRVVPMVLSNKEPVILSFDDVPGPKTLKYLSNVRQYLSQVGTQLMAGALTVGLNIGTYINNRKPLKSLSVLFDEYGPVVRFVSPMGGDIVLINHPDHIQKVYTMEGESPVRSALDSLEKYRLEHRNHAFSGIYSVHGPEWIRQRSTVSSPLHDAVALHMHGLNDVCESFVQKVYNMRNHQDEVPKDLMKDIHKWAFDCIGLIVFSKRFTMLDTELIYSQCDMSWLYHSLEKATEAIVKCESGMHLWKLFTTPAWYSLVKNCDSLDSLIGKHVMEAEQSISIKNKTENVSSQHSLIDTMLLGEERMNAEDITTVIMDMLLIGVNTITSSMAFLLYHLAKYQRAQKHLHEEIGDLSIDLKDFKNIKEKTPYLQACIKENLRLVPPIPVLTRILPKNIILDRYNIPRGTLIIMSAQDTALKESNFEDANAFKPERWNSPDAKDYHAFASIPFGHGARKCLGQNVAETMMTLLTIRLVQKYKLEYHYGDIEPTKTFIAKPNRALKIRFIDRTQ